MEVEATWERAVKVWWALLWRNVLAAICAALIGGVIGAIIGVVGIIVGLSESAVGYLSMPAGVVVGILVSLVPVKMVLNKNFGAFRLALVPIGQKNQSKNVQRPMELNTLADMSPQ